MDTKREHRTHAEGSPRGKPCDLTYSPSGRLIGKSRSNSSVTLSASADMAYGYCDDYQPHAVKRMFDYKNGMLYDMRWDDAGNLGQVSMAEPGEMFETGRFLYWTEDCCGPRPCGANRMHAAIDDKYYSYYAYDHNGERRIKLVGDNDLLDVNADFMSTYTLQNAPTLYPSAYMVLTNKGYTKHYYAGTERVAARLGSGGLDALGHVVCSNGALQEVADVLFDQSFDQVNNRSLQENNLECIRNSKFAKPEFSHPINDIPLQMKAIGKVDYKWFKDIVNTLLRDQNDGQEDDVYFYHSDHLGSASWITDFNGIAVQHLQYLPYGEPYINQHLSSYYERFTFTGKERDEETGYGYFGARYMDHELMTMWMSVDPMADKYPGISPYNYCAWNPVKLVDPNGRDWYQAKDGSVCWNKGNSSTHTVNGVEYKNIGSTYSYTKGNITYNFNQNEVESIDFSQSTSSDFPVQITSESKSTKSLSDRISDLEWNIDHFMQHDIGDEVAKFEDVFIKKSQSVLCGLAVTLPIVSEVNAIRTITNGEDIFGNQSEGYDYLLSTLSLIGHGIKWTSKSETMKKVGKAVNNGLAIESSRKTIFSNNENSKSKRSKL